MKIELIRSYLSDRTVGYMQHGGKVLCRTLERKWNDNERNVSCIPEGAYTVKRDRAGRFQWFRVENVTGRTHIELHGGVTPDNSDGCILIGKRLTKENNLVLSHEALTSLVDYVGDGDWQLVVRQFNPFSDKWQE